MPSATITSKGQITLPRTIRELLRVGAGDRVDFVVDERGEVTVRAARLDVSALRGLLHQPGRRPVSVEEMKAAIERVHAKKE